MPLAESLPERKNLSVLSILIIVFTLGGAHLNGDTLSFPFISLQFENKVFLVLFVWIML